MTAETCIDDVTMYVDLLIHDLPELTNFPLAS